MEITTIFAIIAVALGLMSLTLFFSTKIHSAIRKKAMISAIKKAIENNEITKEQGDAIKWLVNHMK